MWISHSLSDSTLLLASTSPSFVLISVHHCFLFLDFFRTFSQPSHFFKTYSLYFLFEKTKTNPKRSYPFKTKKKKVVQMFFFFSSNPGCSIFPPLHQQIISALCSGAKGACLSLRYAVPSSCPAVRQLRL